MTKVDLRSAIMVLELTAHSCVNKVADRIQSRESAHKEIRQEFERFGVEYLKMKRRRQSQEGRKP